MVRAQGLRAWLLQRLSALYMAAYLFFFLLNLIAQKPHGYESWRAFITAPVMSVATFLLFIMLLSHAWVGMRDVVMDYVHPFRARLTILAVIAIGLIAMASWVLLVLARAM